MKKVLVLGAGMVTKPMIDYYLDTCRYEVVLASRTVAKCERMIAAGFPSVLQHSPSRHGERRAQVEPDQPRSAAEQQQRQDNLSAAADEVAEQGTAVTR